MSPDVVEPVLLVLSAPTGGGKTTVAHRLIETDGRIRFSVSHTTRAPRPGEIDGTDYHFVEESEFRKIASRGEFLEWAEVHGHLYGTHSLELEAAGAEGKDLLLDIDVQGGLQVREKADGAVLVFLIPPSLDTLLERIGGRKRESGFDLVKRIGTGAKELEMAKEYDYNVVNRDLSDTVKAVSEILDVSRMRACRSFELRSRLEVEMRSWLRSKNVHR